MKAIQLTGWIVPVLMPIMILTQAGCGAPPTDGPGGAAEVSTSSVATDAHLRDGETVFRGVFFGQGPVASLFPETWNGNKTVAPVGALTNEGLVTALSAQIERMTAEGESSAAITQLTTLRKQVRDGSVDATTLVASAKYDTVLVDAKIERVIVAMKNADPAFFHSFGDDMQSGDHVRVQSAYLRAQKTLLNAATAADLTSNAGGSLHGDCVALYLVVVIGLFFWVAFPDPQVAKAGSPLGEDEYVDLLATRLATN